MLPLGTTDITLPAGYDSWEQQVGIGFEPNIVVIAGFKLDGAYQNGTMVLRAFDVGGAAPVQVAQATVAAGTNYPRGYYMTGARIDVDRGVVTWADGRTPWAVAFRVTATSLTVGGKYPLDYLLDQGTDTHGRIFPLNHGDSALPYGSIEPTPGGMGLSTLSSSPVATLAFDAVARWYPPGPGLPNLDYTSVYQRFAGVKLTVDSALAITVGDWYWLEAGAPYYAAGGTLQYRDGQTATTESGAVYQVVYRLPDNVRELRATNWSVTPPVQAVVQSYTNLDYRWIVRHGQGVGVVMDGVLASITGGGGGTLTPQVPPVTFETPESFLKSLAPAVSSLGTFVAMTRAIAPTVYEVTSTGVLQSNPGVIDISGHSNSDSRGISVLVVGRYVVAICEWEVPVAPYRTKSTRMQTWSLGSPPPLSPIPLPSLRLGDGISGARFTRAS